MTPRPLTAAEIARAPDLPLAPGCTVTLRNGQVRGPLKPSPMLERVWFDPDGYLWDQDGTLLGFLPGGLMDIVKVTP